MRARHGFTVVEIMVAMTLTLAVFAITLPFVRAQTRALGAAAGRMDADQVARYAQRAVDQDLRLAGAVAGQPLLVLAGPMAVAFNVNLLASDSTDVGAVRVEAGAPASLTESWAPADAATLPGTARDYPAQDYLDAAGARSRFETVTFFLLPDTISDREDDYALFRRVNGRDSTLVVRNLQVPADSAFFSYLAWTGSALAPIAEGRLPLPWDSLAVDSIRAVGIRATGMYRDRASGAVTMRTVRWTTMLRNAATRLGTSCGAAPGAPSSVVAAKSTATQPYRVTLTWSRSADDGTGANDVRRYVVLGRASGATNYATLGTVTATGAATYRWDRGIPSELGTREYTVQAVDCGGAPSSVPTASSVTLP